VTTRDAAEWTFQIYMRDYMSWQRGAVSERAAFFASVDHTRTPAILNWAKWLRYLGLSAADVRRLVAVMDTSAFSDSLVQQLRREQTGMLG
jgi:hypothetical protein